jgi:4-diphosphocytidyl-2-C-methyl-D-erythritol kinase
VTQLQITAHAKLNLALDVVGKRPDGYHDLAMVMQEISLGDQLALTLGTGQPWQVLSDSGQIPCDDSNLAVKAARLFFAETKLDCGGLTFSIQKRTPVCAGMGGGSADGAAVLRLLDDYYHHPLSQETLYRLAEATGSDVPFALFGGTALAQEKGQVLSRLPSLPDCTIVLCKPPFPVSTPALFRAIDQVEIIKRPNLSAMLQALDAGDLNGVASLLYNVFAPVVYADHPELVEIETFLRQQGALGACMTGSGPTMFGLFDHPDLAANAYQILKSQYSDTFLVHPV